jgi:hypothetical protein
MTELPEKWGFGRQVVNVIGSVKAVDTQSVSGD